MLKKLTLLAMSVGALIAFAAPAAQATGPLITDGEGKSPTYITAVGTNITTHTTNATLECTTVDLTIHLTENANTTAKGHGTGTGVGVPPEDHDGHCKAGSLFVDITSVTVSDIHLTKHGTETTGTATFSYTYDLLNSDTKTVIAECTFGGTVPVKKTGANEINVLGEIKKTAGGLFCPSAGTLTGDFDVYEHGSEVDPVTIH